MDILFEKVYTLVTITPQGVRRKLEVQEMVFFHGAATTETRIATAHCPEYGPIHQHLGLARRIIQAEGVFYGANAKTQYTALEALMWQATAGNLRIPGMGVVVAFPTALSYTGEGDGTVLRYTAEFTELIASTDREGTRYVD